ncbi:MAG: zinc-dependent peptidase [Gemmatimonadales bacterium]
MRGGATNPFDGANVALHEFAHQLDMAADAADGIPMPTGVSTYSSWARMLTREYEMLRRAAERGRPASSATSIVRTPRRDGSCPPGPSPAHEGRPAAHSGHTELACSAVVTSRV